MIELNEFQTQIDDLFFEHIPDPDHKGEFLSAPQEVRDQFFEFLNSVPYIKWLVSKDRPRAKDRPRDEQGRIIVDLARPHILEDMDYFRPSAIHYEKHGCYTFLKPNANPNSEFGKWIRRERDRCWYGMVRPDGEWIPGLMYFYLNYCPIMLSQTKAGSNRAERVEGFPKVWEGVYLRFHYLEQARNAGMHAIELARRGCSKSYSLATIMSHHFIFGESKEACRRQTTVLTAYTKEYLSGKDGTISKFLPIIDHVAATMEWPRQRIKNSMQDFMWQAGYIDVSTGQQKGSLNMVLGVSSKDDSEKLRGKRGWFLIEEMGCHIKGTKVLIYGGGEKNVEDVVVGDVLIGDDGFPREVEELYSGTDMMYKVTLGNGDEQIVNSKHLIYFIQHRWSDDRDIEHLKTADEILQMHESSKGFYIPKATVEYAHKDVPIDPYAFGLWLGNGDKSQASIATGDAQIIEWLRNKYKGCSVGDMKITDKCKSVYIHSRNGFIAGLKELGVLKNKHVPDCYKYNDSDTQLKVIAGFVDTDGYFNQTKTSCCYEIVQCKEHLEILKAIKFMATNNGLRCTMHSKVAGKKTKKPGETYYVLRISGDIWKIPVVCDRKKASVPVAKYKQRRNWNNYGFKVEPYGRGEYYGFKVGGNHLFLLDDLTVVHNCFPNLTTVYNIIRHGVEEGDYTYGMIYLVGTSAEDASDFAAAKSLLYAPSANHIYQVENVYDKANQGRPLFGYFFPAYVNRLGCMNEDGVSDVTKALLQILMRRHKAKYDSSDPSLILKTIAEMPITPAEAIMKVARNMFPVGDLTNRLGEIDGDPAFYDRTYIADLQLRDGRVVYTPSSKLPIREFPHENNKIEGAVEIYELPQTGSDGKVFSNRYIASCLTKGQLVNTSEGLKKVENVALTDKLVNKEGKDVSIRNIQVRSKNENVYSVKISNVIDSVTFTAEHPIFVCRPVVKYYGRKMHDLYGCPEVYWRMKFGFVHAEKLKPGDVVKAPNVYMQEKPFMHYWDDNDVRCDRVIKNPLNSPEFWWLIGVVLGNGWASSNGHTVSIAICDKNKEDKEVVARIINSLFRRNCHTKQSVSCCQISFSCKQLNEFIGKYIGHGAANKGIAEWMKFIPARHKKQLVLGYLATDGCISGKNAEFVSVSKKLCCDLQDILFSLGIISNVTLLRKSSTHVICGKECPTLETYHVRIGQIGIIEMKSWTRRKTKLDNFESRPIDKKRRRKKCWFGANNKYIYFLVTDVEATHYDGPVYNFECDTHTFMAGGYFPTHNCDPYENDQSTTMSLGSIFVLDLWTDRIVAEYTGRPMYADEFHEICRRLALFFNSPINYENNKKGLFSYFSRMSCLHLLTDTLEFLRDKNLVKGPTFGNTSKGTCATLPINSYARSLIREWLLKPVQIKKEVKGEDGEYKEETETVPNLYFLRGRALIQELINYNDEGNFDRVSSLGMLMLLREDRMALYHGELDRSKDEQKTGLAYSDFFNRYDKDVAPKYKKISL